MNDLIAANRKHAQAGAKLKRDWQEVVCWQISFALNRGALKAVKKPVIVHFTWVERTDKRDLDNISSMGRKVILDALVQMKIIPNDNRKWVRGFSDMFFNGEKDYIKVEIEEIEK